MGIFDDHFGELGADICGLQECKVLGETVVDREDLRFKYYFSGPPLGMKREHGVGFAVRKKFSQAVKVHYVSARLMWAKVTFGVKILYVVVAYAPSQISPEAASQKRRDAFYISPDIVMAAIKNDAKCKGGTLPNVVILGDFNARVGIGVVGEDASYPIVGPCSSDTDAPTIAGDDLINFCSEHSFRIEDTFFAPGPSGSGTFIHANDRSQQEGAAVDDAIACEVFTNCIDHILTRVAAGTFRSIKCGVPQVEILEPLSNQCSWFWQSNSWRQTH